MFVVAEQLFPVNTFLTNFSIPNTIRSERAYKFAEKCRDLMRATWPEKPNETQRAVIAVDSGLVQSAQGRIFDNMWVATDTAIRLARKVA